MRKCGFTDDELYKMALDRMEEVEIKMKREAN
jgi:hypothetical protein